LLAQCPQSLETKLAKNKKEKKDVHDISQGTPSHPSSKSKHAIPLSSAAVSVKFCCFGLPSP